MARIMGRAVLSLAILGLMAGPTRAQKHEIGLTLGGTIRNDVTSTSGTKITLDSGRNWQANYAYRLFDARLFAVSVGTHFLANESRRLNSPVTTAPREIASLYITPDIVVKILPHARIQPWGTIGGGYALYESSSVFGDGTPIPGGKIQTHRGALVYGGGVDVPVWKFLALRAEIRDFYTGRPPLTLSVGGSQHNVVAGGGFVIRLGK